jgi:hypothetical protein
VREREQVFDCLDVNNDGFMTRTELTGLLDAVAAVRYSFSREPGVTRVGQVGRESGVRAPLGRARRI